MRAVLAITAAAIALSGCSVPANDATGFLAAQGYTDVKLGGADFPFSSCSEDDNLTRKFSATAPNGSHVQGVVCAGMFFKGATIRLNKVEAASSSAATSGPLSNPNSSQDSSLCRSYLQHRDEPNQRLVFMDETCS